MNKKLLAFLIIGIFLFSAVAVLSQDEERKLKPKEDVEKQGFIEKFVKDAVKDYITDLPIISQVQSVTKTVLGWVNFILGIWPLSYIRTYLGGEVYFNLIAETASLVALVSLLWFFFKFVDGKETSESKDLKNLFFKQLSRIPFAGYVFGFVIKLVLIVLGILRTILRFTGPAYPIFKWILMGIAVTIASVFYITGFFDLNIAYTNQKFFGGMLGASLIGWWFILIILKIGLLILDKLTPGMALGSGIKLLKKIYYFVTFQKGRRKKAEEAAATKEEIKVARDILSGLEGDILNLIANWLHEARLKGWHEKEETVKHYHNLESQFRERAIKELEMNIKQYQQLMASIALLAEEEEKFYKEEKKDKKKKKKKRRLE